MFSLPPRPDLSGGVCHAELVEAQNRSTSVENVPLSFFRKTINALTSLKHVQDDEGKFWII